MKKNNIISYIIWAFLSAFIYIILSENITFNAFIIGLMIGISALVICMFFFDKKYIINNNIKMLSLVWYTINLVFIIIISGFNSLVLAIFHESTSEQLTYNSYLKNDILITLLANSITLTPGTVTVDKQDSNLIILKLCKKDCNVDLDDIRHLEKMISKIERG
jgi:multicomponent Na+:H+ antiporter subunit E